MSTTLRGACVHGHFYQPPRENPWTGRIDREPSAAPWENWNERITDECYAPNTVAEVRFPDGHTETHDNLASMSFNFGPTLMTWLADSRPDVHEAILGADRAGRDRFGGHGPALAQPYDHVILPLARERDRRTQVRWGVQDFHARFGRAPAGMWLPETAADLPTLRTLAEEGIRFTVLAPHQARRVRSEQGDGTPARALLDPGRPYRIRLGGDLEIAAFFYHGGIAHAVAFGGLLHDGRDLAERIATLARAGDTPRLAHVATDGESYGHHHRHGEMALASALLRLEEMDDVRNVCYAQWLALHPATEEAELEAPGSWSCEHGVRRWAGGCDCGAAVPGGTTWRAPLRAALERLAEELARRFDRADRWLLRPWEARDEYVALSRLSGGERDAWWERHLAPGADRHTAGRWLRMQASAMRMFTSCGWFFEDPARLETRQVLRYAAHALDLAGAWDEAGAPTDPAGQALLGDLEAVRSPMRPGWTAAGEMRRILRIDRRPISPSPA